MKHINFLVLVVVATIFALSNSYGQTTITANVTVKGADVIVKGDIQAESGTVDGDGSVFLTGDWTSLGSYPITGSELQVVFNGMTLQLIAGDSTMIPKLVLNNITGLQIANTTGYLEVPDTLRLLSGVLDMNGNVVDLHFGYLVGEDNTNYVTDTVNDGQIWSTQVLNAPVVADPGNLRLSISSSDNLDTVQVRRGHVPQGSLGSDAQLYYEVESTGSLSTANIEISYLDYEVSDPADSFDIWQLDGSWAPLTTSYGTNTSQATVIVWGERITLQNTVMVGLPIELVRFESACKDGSIELRWTTATEINNDYFNISKSPDGLQWSVLDSTLGAGNSTSYRSYMTVDDNPWNITYYKLTQVDYDGNSESFDIIAQCCCNREYMDMSVYPVPTNGNLTVLFSSSEPVDIHVLDILGKVVLTKHYQQPGPYEMDLSELAAGPYHVSLQTANMMKTKQIIITD